VRHGCDHLHTPSVFAQGTVKVQQQLTTLWFHFIYPTIASLLEREGFEAASQTASGVVTLNQRFGAAENLEFLSR
jgi:hypothetical protein